MIRILTIATVAGMIASPAVAQVPDPAQSMTRAAIETSTVQAVALMLKKLEPAACRWCSGPAWDSSPAWVDTKKADALSYATVAAGPAIGLLLPLFEPDDVSTKAQREMQLARAIAYTQLFTEAAKVFTARERPNRVDAVSFWSEHSAIAATAAAQAWKHGHRRAALLADVPLMVATGYLRTRAGAHHPMDVIVGMLAGGTIGFVLP